MSDLRTVMTRDGDLFEDVVERLKQLDPDVSWRSVAVVALAVIGEWLDAHVSDCTVTETYVRTVVFDPGDNEP